MYRSGTVCVVVMCMLACVHTARADFEFSAITANDPLNPGIGEQQFSMTLSDLGSSQVLFEIFNAGPQPSSIELIAFDGDALTAILAIIDGPGTDFSLDNNPRTLPGGNSVGFSTDFSASAGSPPPMKGINPGESVGILGQGDFAAIMADLISGDLRIGLHAISMGASGNSESFVSHAPGPSGLIAMLVAGGLTRRSRRRSPPC